MAETIGDDELPTDVPPVNLGGAATSVVAGSLFSCALMDSGSVRCWGFGGNGRTGLGSTEWIGDDEPPSSAEVLDLGESAVQITAGDHHACALLQSGNVTCWGAGASGALGYASTDDVGDDESPASAGYVDIGGSVVAIDAGGNKTCVVLSDGAVRCWGEGATGGLGYGSTDDIGDDETPASAGNVPF